MSQQSNQPHSVQVEQPDALRISDAVAIIGGIVLGLFVIIVLFSTKCCNVGAPSWSEVDIFASCYRCFPGISLPRIRNPFRSRRRTTQRYGQGGGTFVELHSVNSNSTVNGCPSRMERGEVRWPFFPDSSPSDNNPGYVVKDPSHRKPVANTTSTNNLPPRPEPCLPRKPVPVRFDFTNQRDPSHRKPVPVRTTTRRATFSGPSSSFSFSHQPRDDPSRRKPVVPTPTTAATTRPGTPDGQKIIPIRVALQRFNESRELVDVDRPINSAQRFVETRETPVASSGEIGYIPEIPLRRKEKFTARVEDDEEEEEEK